MRKDTHRIINERDVHAIIDAYISSERQNIAPHIAKAMTKALTLQEGQEVIVGQAQILALERVKDMLGSILPYETGSARRDASLGAILGGTHDGKPA